MDLADQILALVSVHTDNQYKIYPSAKGRQLNVRCPFHKGGRERTPSFYWNLDNGLFFCHTCKIAGGLPSFLKLAGLSRDDIDHIVKNTEYSPLLKQLHNPFRRHRKINVLASNPVLPEQLLGMFDFHPNRMTTWGFSDDVICDYDIGYDIQRKRITFPIRDVYGRLVGISGRADSDMLSPRYLIYSEKELGDVVPGYQLEKSHLLWNIHRIWAAQMSQSDTYKWEPIIILVEGFKAALYMIQHGYTNTVALLGSSMSQVQRYILSVLGGDVFVFLDNDPAGLSGSLKIYRELRTHSSCRPHLVIYPDGFEGAQPDSLEPKLIDHLLKEAM